MLGLLALVYPFVLEAGSFKVSLFATECACCILGWALVAGMGVSITPDTGFLSSDLLHSDFDLGLYGNFLDPLLCGF